MRDSITLHGREIYYGQPAPENPALDEQAVANMERLEPKVHKGTPGAIKELKQLSNEFPDIPQYRNLLAIAYKNSGNPAKCLETLESVLQQYPDYIYGRTNLAIINMNNGDFDKVPTFLGEEMSLFTLFPDRMAFHAKELLSYNRAAISYLIYTLDYYHALIKLQEMEEVAPEDPQTLEARNMLAEFWVEFMADEWDEDDDMEDYMEVRDRGYNKSIQTRERPVFHHELIHTLYEKDLFIKAGDLDNILALPRETLIEDLQTVLEDSIKRFEYYRDETEKDEFTHSFPLHALFLLAELESSKSLPVVLNFLRQGKELLEYWLEDYLIGELWEIIYHLGADQPEILKEFVKEPDNFLYARSAVTQVMEQKAMHQPERREEIIAWYRDIMEYFLNNIDDESIIDPEQINFMIWECLNLKAFELKDLMEAFEEQDLIIPSMVGTIEDIMEELEEGGVPEEYNQLLVFSNVYSRYDYLNSGSFIENNEFLDPFDWEIDEEQLATDQERMLRESDQRIMDRLAASSGPAANRNKVGRNDPCPCGSGRKYKKCCMEK